MGDLLTLNVIEDLAIAASGVDIFRNEDSAQVDEPTLAFIYMNRESVDVTAQVKAGPVEVMAIGPSVVQATVGNPPLVPDNRVVACLLQAGQRLSVNGTNVNAAAQELRAVAFMVPLSDAINLPSLLSNM